MLISPLAAKELVEALKEQFKVVPHITEQGILKISYQYMEPLLELLEMNLEDIENSKAILKDLLVLLSGAFSNEVRKLEIGLGSDACPDEFLQKNIVQILEKHITIKDTVDTESLQSTFKIIYPVMYQLLHEYRFNKNPNRLDIDHINLLMISSHRPMLQKFKKLSEKIGQNNTEPTNREIEFIVLWCFKLELEKLKIKLSIKNEEKINIEEAFVMASTFGFVDVMARLIKKRKVNTNVLVNGLSPLSIACFRGDMPTVQLLIENNANIGQKTKGGATALYLACQSGHKEIVKFLLSCKKAEKIIEQATDEGYTPLIITAERGFLEIVELLLSKKANIEQKSNGGVTALYSACQNGYKSIVELLLRHKDIGKIIDQATNSGAAPLIIAVQKGFLEIVKMLLSKDAKIGQKTDMGATALYLACYNGHNNIVNILLNHKEIRKIINQAINNGFTPLMIAAEKGFLEIVVMLLIKNANIEQKNNDGATALHCACYYGHYAIAEFLLKRNANIASKANDDVTVLFFACQNGHKSIVELLLRHKDIGKIIDQATDKGYTPLMIAAARGFLEIVEMLLKKNANVTPKANMGTTALSLADEFGYQPIVELLLFVISANNIKKSPVLTFSYGLTPTNVNHTDTSSRELSDKEAEKFKLKKG